MGFVCVFGSRSDGFSMCRPFSSDTSRLRKLPAYEMTSVRTVDVPAGMLNSPIFESMQADNHYLGGLAEPLGPSVRSSAIAPPTRSFKVVVPAASFSDSDVSAFLADYESPATCSADLERRLSRERALVGVAESSVRELLPNGVSTMNAANACLEMQRTEYAEMQARAAIKLAHVEALAKALKEAERRARSVSMLETMSAMVGTRTSRVDEIRNVMSEKKRPSSSSRSKNKKRRIATPEQKPKAEEETGEGEPPEPEAGEPEPVATAEPEATESTRQVLEIGTSTFLPPPEAEMCQEVEGRPRRWASLKSLGWSQPGAYATPIDRPQPLEYWLPEAVVPGPKLRLTVREVQSIVRRPQMREGRTKFVSAPMKPGVMLMLLDSFGIREELDTEWYMETKRAPKPAKIRFVPFTYDDHVCLLVRETGSKVTVYDSYPDCFSDLADDPTNYNDKFRTAMVEFAKAVFELDRVDLVCMTPQHQNPVGNNCMLFSLMWMQDLMSGKNPMIYEVGDEFVMRENLMKALRSGRPLPSLRSMLG